MILDGRNLARDIQERTRARAAALVRPPVVEVVVADTSPATRSYLAIKNARAAEAGCILQITHLGAAATTKELCDAIANSQADALLVQLPLSEGVDTQAVCDAIPLEKDADVLSREARALGRLLPPVAAAVAEIFERNQIEVRDKRAVVVGAGYLVGQPVAAWLARAGALVEVLTRDSNVPVALETADIIVSGAGNPHLIQPLMVKEGVVLVDAGASESGGAIVGDADPACAPRCSLFTPVPGGLGPLAVAKLFENAVTLAEQKEKSKV